MDENLVNLGPNYGPLAEIHYFNEMYNSYCWHFRIKDKPATHEQMIRFANWYGLKEKQPSKRQIVQCFLDNKVHL